MKNFRQMLSCFLVFLLIDPIRGALIAITDAGNEWFPDVEANFGATVGIYGVTGELYVAEPLDGCGEVSNGGLNGTEFPFALIIRGQCSFVEKVMNAQKAGFRGVFVYDNLESGNLVAMTGYGEGIIIPAVFVGRTTGEILKEYSQNSGIKVTILRSFRVPVSLMAISLMFLLGSCCWYPLFKKLQRDRRLGQYRDPVGTNELGGSVLKALRSEKFTLDMEDNCTSRICAICYADYEPGDKLRVLPCRHKFHAVCVDEWLTKCKLFCPVCKHDVREEFKSPPASDSTPLLSSCTATSYST